MTSKVSRRFWRQFHELPAEIQALSRKNYQIWLGDPHYPAVRFKPFHGRLYSACVGEHYRAVGFFSGPDEFTWIWIGSHADYDKFRG